MKNKATNTALENYELLKLKRILLFNQKGKFWVNRSILVLLFILAFMLQMLTLMAQTQPAPSIALTEFCTGFTTPIVIANCGDSRLFIGQKNGYIYIVDKNGNKLTTPFLDIDAIVGSTGNEQGLLGICFHPKYISNGYFYVYFTDNNGNTKVNRYTRNAANPNIADVGTAFPIFSLTQPAANHNGGCIQFGPDGYLYIGLGDGGSNGDPNNYGQNRLALLGKMLRIDVNNGNPYSIPASNPFAMSTTTLPEIWAIGLRNPWRWSFDRLTGDMWIGDVGEGTWEEVDYQPAGVGGRNYGWRCYEGNHAYNVANCTPQNTYTSPVSEYQHSAGNGCSIIGGYVYRGGKYANLFGHYLTADYCSGVIRDISPNGSGGWNTANLGAFQGYQYTAFGEDNHGELYLAELVSGRIMKIKDNSCLPTAYVKGAASQTACTGEPFKLESIYGNGNTYQWQKNNVNLTGATNPNHTVTVSGNYRVIVTNSSGCSNTSNVINVAVVTSPLATATPNGPTSFCKGSSVVLNANTGTGLTYQWLKYGSTISGSTASSYTASKTGNYKVRVTASNGCSTTSNVVSVNVTCKIEGSIDEFSSFKCLPNPSNGNFLLQFNANREQLVSIQVKDVLGKIIYKDQKTSKEGINQLDISLSEVPKGLYLINFTIENQIYTEKILIQ